MSAILRIATRPVFTPGAITPAPSIFVSQSRVPSVQRSMTRTSKPIRSGTPHFVTIAKSPGLHRRRIIRSSFIGRPRYPDQILYICTVV